MGLSACPVRPIPFFFFIYRGVLVITADFSSSWRGRIASKRIINDTNVGCYNKSPNPSSLKQIKFGYTPLWELNDVVISPYIRKIKKVLDTPIGSNGICSNDLCVDSSKPTIYLLLKIRMWASYKWAISCKTFILACITIDYWFFYTRYPTVLPSIEIPLQGTPYIPDDLFALSLRIIPQSSACFIYAV